MIEDYNSDDIEEAFALLGAAGWNPRRIDESIVHYENYARCGEPTMMGDVCCEDFYLPHDMISIHPKIQIDVKGNSMRDAGIDDGDTITVMLGASPADGDIMVVEIDQEATVKAYFEDEEGQRWLVPFNKDYSPIELKEGMEVRMVGRVIEVVKKNPRQSYRDCQRIVNASKAKSAKAPKPSVEQQERAIIAIADKVSKGRQWFAVYRPLVDIESELVNKGDFDGFCRLVKRLCPLHEHLPTAQELQRMDDKSFRRPVLKWNEYDAPVSGNRFWEYKRIADDMGGLLAVNVA